MFDDDDMKIGLFDIVSVLFGEEIEKVDAAKAKEILKNETKEFMEKGDFSVAQEITASLSPEDHKLSTDEETMLKEYEVQRNRAIEDAPATPQINAFSLPPIPAPGAPVDVDALRKQIEQEVKEKLLREMEEEKMKKRRDVLDKIDANEKARYMAQAAKPAAPAPQAQSGAGELYTSHADKVMIVQMFEQSQKIFGMLLSKLIRRKPVETMFLKTLEQAMEKNIDVLRKVDYNIEGKIRTDGTIETGRLLANVSAVQGTEEQKSKRMLAALSAIFEERLIATEIAVGIDVKDDLMSNVLMQMERIFGGKAGTDNSAKMFFEHVVPSTTMKQGDH